MSNINKITSSNDPKGGNFPNQPNVPTTYASTFEFGLLHEEVVIQFYENVPVLNSSGHIDGMARKPTHILYLNTKTALSLAESILTTYARQTKDKTQSAESQKEA